MSGIPNWSPTAYYLFGDRVSYLSTVYELVAAGSSPAIFSTPPPANPAAWVESSAGGGVASISTNGANPLVNNVNVSAGVGIGLSVAGQTIQISNLNPSVTQQGIIALKDSAGTSSTSFTPQMTCSVLSTAGASPSASYTVTNTGTPPTATSNFALNLQIPPVPTVTGVAPGITVTGSAAEGGYSISNTGVLALTAGSGISVAGDNTNLTVGNSGVLALTAGSGISITGDNTNLTIESAGGGVTSLNTRSGALTLAAGTDISIVESGGNTFTINAINQPISNRSSGTPNTLITATTGGTAQLFGTVNLNTTATYDINVWITLGVTAGTGGGEVGVRAYAVLNGLQIGATHSLQLPSSVHTHPMTLTFIASSFNVPAGANPFGVKVFATTGSVVTLNQFQIIALGNLA